PSTHADRMGRVPSREELRACVLSRRAATIRLSSMAARSLEEELERLCDNSLDAVLIAGFDGFLRRANRGFARLLRYSLEELLARPFMDNLHPRDVDAVRVALAARAE